MSTEIKVSFIIQRNDQTMHPTESFYNEETKTWDSKPTGIVYPKYEELSSAVCNQLKELSFIMDNNASYKSVDKELWDVLGISKALEDEKDNTYPCISPRMEIFYNQLTEEEINIKNNIKKYIHDYKLFKELLAKSTNKESYDLNYENMSGQQELIEYCKSQLDIIKDFKSIWNYMEEEERLHYGYDKESGITTKDKLRVFITYYY